MLVSLASASKTGTLSDTFICWVKGRDSPYSDWWHVMRIRKSYVGMPNRVQPVALRSNARGLDPLRLRQQNRYPFGYLHLLGEGEGFALQRLVARGVWNIKVKAVRPIACSPWHCGTMSRGCTPSASAIGKRGSKKGPFFLWRRRRDSNPRGLSPKRFSRPPRYDRFDTPPRR